MSQFQTGTALLTQVLLTNVIFHCIPLLNVMWTGKIPISAVPPASSNKYASAVFFSWFEWHTKFVILIFCTALEVATSTLGWVIVSNPSSSVLEWCYWSWVAMRFATLAAKRAFFDGHMNGDGHWAVLITIVSITLIFANLCFINDASPEKIALAVTSCTATFV